MSYFRGKTIIVTGASSGIGEATAKEFLSKGAKVILVARSESKMHDSFKDFNQDSYSIYPFDLTNLDDIDSFVKMLIKKEGPIDILFNNAGGPVGAGFVEDPLLENVTQKNIDYGVHLLLASVILGTKYAIEPMRKNGGGCIINNSSIAGLRYRQGDSLYSSLKAAVTHFTKMSGVELGKDNIRVNAISPGAVATPIFWGGSQVSNSLSDEENERKLKKLQGNLAKAVPLNRSGLAVDIAEAALFLSSEAGSFITCHDLVVDGGRTSMFNESLS